MNYPSMTKTMPVNSSASEVPNSNLSDSFYVACQQSVASTVIFSVYTAFTIFVLTPLFTLVLYTGFQQRRRQRSSPAGMTMSNTDFFTYSMMIVEIISVVGSVTYSLAVFILDDAMLKWGVVVSSISLFAQTVFHLLTSVDRYLAVVYPLAYMHLREAARVRIRNISSLLALLLSFVWMGVTYWYYPGFPVAPLFSLLGFCIFVMLVCCVSVVYVLVRPGPGQEGAKKQQVDQSKKRAFQMIMSITCTLIVRSVGLLFWLGLLNYDSFNIEVLCVFIDLGLWLTVPSSLVLPLLFFHRAGKLSCTKKGNASG